MAFLSSLNISGSALTAERFRIDVISQNISHSETTMTPNGKPYGCSWLYGVSSFIFYYGVAYYLRK